MINFNKKDAVADSIARILQQEESECVTKPEAKNIAKKEVKGHEKSMHHKEEIDVNDRTEDMIGGRVKTKRKDDVGPGTDGKSTKVRFHAGPKNEEYETKELTKGKPPATVKTAKPQPEKMEDKEAKRERKMLGMKESISLKMFKEKYEESSIYDDLINEVLSKDASAGAWIHDFVHSDNPKFAGKSKEERKKQALAAYYAKQKNEEVEQIEEGRNDTPVPYSSLSNRPSSATVAQTGPRKGMITKKHITRLKDRIKASLSKEEVEQIEEGLMTGITLGKKVKNDEGGHDQVVHHKGKKIGTISSYSHRTGTRYGMTHDASNDATAGSRSHEEALADLRYSHAEHLKSMKNEEVEQIEEGLGHWAIKQMARLANKNDLEWHHVNVAQKEIDNKLKNHPQAASLLNKHKKMAKDAQYHKKSDDEARQHFADNMQTLHNDIKSTHSVKEETFEEGWDDMVKSAKDSVKSGPKPSGGSGVKKGSRYGGGKQADKPEHDDEKPVKEAKDPNMDAGVGSGPNFTKNESKPLTVAKHLAKKSMARMKSEMLGKAPGNN